MQRLSAKEFGAVMFLEAVQNIPLIGGFVAAYSFWQRSWLLVAVSILAGSILSALSMIPTEGRIFGGHRESARAIVANVAIFSVLMFAFTAYMQANWSSYWTDLVGGLIAGAALGMGQDLAARERIGVVRILALGISCLVSLLVIRFAVTAWPPLVSFAVVTVWFTLAMGGYKLWRRRVPPPK
jgi:hypothetical protein